LIPPCERSKRVVFYKVQQISSRIEHM